ncbi:MAG: helix-turn-helix domain-containing protein [Planctomycetota bacterium]|jgi:transcriptional regulator with XRE-family HTH domain
MSRFGALLKQLREDSGLTLQQVAGKVGTTKGYVSSIENGKVNPPSHKFIRKFARLFRHDEKEMTLLAYVDKAPAIIRQEVERLLEPGP